MVIVTDNSGQKWLRLDDALINVNQINIIDLMPHTCDADDPDYEEELGECPLAGKYEVELSYGSFYFSYSEWKDILTALGLESCT